METGTVQINSAPARGPDHFPFQVHYLSMLLNFTVAWECFSLSSLDKLIIMKNYCKSFGNLEGTPLSSSGATQYSLIP
jgi:hypothetical protein